MVKNMIHYPPAAYLLCCAVGILIYCLESQKSDYWAGGGLCCTLVSLRRGFNSLRCFLSACLFTVNQKVLSLSEDCPVHKLSVILISKTSY